MHTQSSPVIRALSLILFAGFISVNSCFGDNSEFGIEDKTPNQPVTKTLYYYTSMYIHYVDSIVNILKQNPLIKPGKYEDFIVNVSRIIPKRFKYGANAQLWIGIRRDRLDCDNTAYLVYDIGKKLGFEVSVVALYCHAMVVVGNYAYETTNRTYFPKKQF
ncbi:MAG: hypothetical protein NT004_13060 [Bacteroidetes bacterium]|nr:hypothetical protein [Bacteroidota bacterium]